MQPITIIAKHGSHLLVRRERRVVEHEYAIVERRGGQVSGVAGAHRQSFADTEQGIEAAVGDGWMEESAARRLFREIAERGDQLARRIW
jgi:N-acetylglutamate synthase-like GNAT family acetyltransferase